MDCRICRDKTDEYFEGKLSSDMSREVEDHLHNCIECAEYFKVAELSGMVISMEKEMEPGPFLASRIMNAIEERDRLAETPVLIRLLKPALLTASLAAAVFTGVLIGNVYKPSAGSPEIPVELAFINDSEMESIDMLSTE